MGTFGVNDMNLNQLYYFRTLAELEHYTKAAEKLNISQPTLSHSIAAMEKELGANLFEKQGRNVVLTKYGRIYIFYVENALTQLELGKNQIERLVSEGGGHVGLAYMTSVGTNFMPKLISDFLDDPQNKNISFSEISCLKEALNNCIKNRPDVQDNQTNHGRQDKGPSPDKLIFFLAGPFFLCHTF